jgi:hypothetical protein
MLLFGAEGKENMITDRAYSPGSLPFMARRTSLFYFAAAVPAVGFVHGPADVNPLNEAMLESYAESCFMNPGRDTIRSLAGQANLGVRCAYR